MTPRVQGTTFCIAQLRPARQVLSVLTLLAVILLAAPVWPQEASGDLVELTLDELLEVQFVPASVMGSHIHAKGEWMVGYQFMNMDMEGNRHGEERMTIDEVLQSFPVTPINMTMQMQMFELMYGVTDRFTFMVMVPYHHKEMDHVTRSGVEFTTTTEGVGDIRLMPHIVVSRRGPHWWVFTPGVSLPTGSIDERGATPAGSDQKLPYPMQLGSGSIEAVPMLNYIYQKERWMVGLHAMGVYSTEENDSGYKVGDRYHTTLFLARKISDAFSISTRLDGQSRKNFSGADPELNPAVVPTADPGLRAGERVDAVVGFNFYLTGRGGGAFGHRLLLEVGWPIFQDLDGPQLETDLNLAFSWQWTF